MKPVILWAVVSEGGLVRDVCFNEVAAKKLYKDLTINDALAKVKTKYHVQKVEVRPVDE